MVQKGVSEKSMNTGITVGHGIWTPIGPSDQGRGTTQVVVSRATSRTLREFRLGLAHSESRLVFVYNLWYNSGGAKITRGRATRP